MSISAPSLYSDGLFHADLTQNGAKYFDSNATIQDPQNIARYMEDVADEKIKPLDFTLYVPNGFDTLSGKKIPNVEITDDPSKIFTLRFQSSAEIWP